MVFRDMRRFTVKWIRTRVVFLIIHDRACNTISFVFDVCGKVELVSVLASYNIAYPCSVHRYRGIVV